MAKIKVLKFTADWCGPCQAMKPVVARFKEAHPEVEVEEVDIDHAERKANKYGVECVPTFVFERDGEETGRVEGSCSLRTLEGLLPKEKKAEKKPAKKPAKKVATAKKPARH